MPMVAMMWKATDETVSVWRINVVATPVMTESDQLSAVTLHPSEKSSWAEVQKTQFSRSSTLPSARLSFDESPRPNILSSARKI
jgi:hypothetical protein